VEIWRRSGQKLRKAIENQLNRLAVALSVISIALISVLMYLQAETARRTEAGLLRLNETVDRMIADGDQLRQQMQAIEAGLADAKAANAAGGTVCDRAFPSGLYRLTTSTDYGANSGGAYEIYHASVTLSEWNINVGTRVNAYGIPTDFYFDYDGDGRIDTALAARFVREIPVAGNTIADRLLADSRVHQNLYEVFSCEWRDAEFTSSDDMNAGVSGASTMLWDLVQEHSENIVEWIREL
jgi:hypothetical protein